MNATHSDHKRTAEQVAAWWATAPRRYRRAGARWYWSRCSRPAHVSQWAEFWRCTNADCGVVHGEIPDVQVKVISTWKSGQARPDMYIG